MSTIPSAAVTALRRAACAALALAATALVGCGGSVAAERDARLRAAGAAVAAQVDDAIARMRAALAEVPAAIDRAGADSDEDRARRFAALEALRLEYRIDGLTWSDPASAAVWAGTPVTPRDAEDLPPPWAGTFRTGDFVYHSGPFRRAVVLYESSPHGGASACEFLGWHGDVADPTAEVLEDRWARRHRVRAVRIVHPDALSTPPPDGVLRVPAGAPPGGAPLLAVEVESRTDAVLAAEILARARSARGWIGLAGLALAAAAAWAAVRRWARGPLARGVGLAGLALLVRQGLRVLDLPGRFTALAPAFDPTDYAVAGYRGWLSSPGDLLLTTAAVLVVAVGLARGIMASRPPAGGARRALAAAAGIAMAAVATRGWISLVEGAPANGRVEVFGHGPLWPTLARGILLSALLLATAAAWTFVRSGLRLVVTSLGGGRPRVASVVAAVAAAAVAVALSRWGEPPLTVWGVLLLPGAAALLGRLAAGDPRPGAPTRMLLISLLAVALLFPVLWVAAADDDRSDLMSEVGALVRGPEDTEAQLPTQLRPLAEDAILVRALERYTVSGGSDEGLALHAWRRLHPGGYGEAIGAVFVHDGEGRRISRFAIEMPPFRRLPEPRPGGPSEDGDVTVTMSRGKGEVLAATTGSLRILSPERAVVGYVSVVVPDPVAVRLAGLTPRLTSRLRSEDPEAIVERPLELALLRADRVVQSTDPTMPRRGPPPVDVSEGAPEWRPATDGGRPWLVVSAGERGTVIARAPPLTFEDGLVAAARMAVVGVGLGGALALLALLVGIRGFRMRLRDKILWSFVAISALPLVALAVTNRSDAVARADEEFRVRQTALARDARREIQGLTEGQVAELAVAVEAFAALRGQDLTAYVDGRCLTSTVQSLVDAEILPSILDASVYRATEIEGRDLVARDEIVGGRTGVRILYTPLRDPLGRIAATLAVPLVFDSARVEEAASRSGSVLFAAYLLALLLLVIAGLWTARGLTKPIEKLAQGTRRVAAGELDATIGTAGRGEIGELIADFDRMTADLRRARERAAVAERETAWRGMARQIAHEIKNPLTPMKLMLQQLLATARSDPRYATEMIEPTARVVLEQIDGLARIAGDFAAFARFPPRALRDVDVDDVLRSVALLYAGGESSPVRVETDLGGGLPSVRWDEDEIRRVYMNLVANAVESRADGQPIVRVTIRSRPGTVPGSGREGVVVTVVDDGVGIPPENRERLFHPSFSTKTHGTGLGLAIVRRIVTDLGGEIRIESEPGRGTRVTTWLPSTGPGASPTVG